MAAASIAKVSQQIYLLPSAKECNEDKAKRLISEFDLNPELCTFKTIAKTSDSMNQSNLLMLRDSMVVQQADMVVPISIRPNGIMSELVANVRRSGKPICDSFVTEYKKRTNSITCGIDVEQRNPELSQLGDRYLIHWTRAASSPWPGERSIDFYSAIINTIAYPRTAFDTLKRIVQSRTILASGRHMPKAEPTVSFSSLSPVEAAPLMRWRARYRQMSFEPYGLAIRGENAHIRGILPVKYVFRRTRENTERTDFWRFQTEGKIGDWKAEQEYRCRGDFTFSDISNDQLFIICRTGKEAHSIEQDSGISAISMLIE